MRVLGLRHRWCAASYIAMLLMSEAGCIGDPLTTVKGIVVDVNHNPIAGASVRLASTESSGGVMMSKPDGSFSVAEIQGPKPGPFLLTISKPGYTTYRLKVQPHSGYLPDVRPYKPQELTVILFKTRGSH